MKRINEAKKRPVRDSSRRYFVHAWIDCRMNLSRAKNKHRISIAERAPALYVAGLDIWRPRQLPVILARLTADLLFRFRNSQSRR